MKYKAHFYLLCCRMTEKKVHKLWNDVDMVAAINAIKTNQMTISGAANHFHVPQKTFDDRIEGHVEHVLSLGEIQFFQQWKKML